MGGYSNVDDTVFEKPGAPFRGVALRSFDSKTQQWSIWWLDSRTPLGPVDPPMRGGSATAWERFTRMKPSTGNRSAHDFYGPRLLRHRVTGSRRTRQMVARRGRPIGCRTSYEFAHRGRRISRNHILRTTRPNKTARKTSSSVILQFGSTASSTPYKSAAHFPRRAGSLP